MKDINEQALKSSRPAVDEAHTVAFCLEKLFDDSDHSINDNVVDGLTFEELIGALLQAHDLIAARDELLQWMVDEGLLDEQLIRLFKDKGIIK